MIATPACVDHDWMADIPTPNHAHAAAQLAADICKSCPLEARHQCAETALVDGAREQIRAGHWYDSHGRAWPLDALPPPRRPRPTGDDPCGEDDCYRPRRSPHAMYCLAHSTETARRRRKAREAAA